MKENYRGMTVNERLYVSGLIKEFDKAVTQKDLDSVKEILKQVKLSDENIIAIIESLQLK